MKPTLSERASEKLIEAYVEMRKMGANTKTITATPRQL
jgi:DNA replicative helicase MCM subunit Mcm2 (Cdc46/Mcm family)